MSDQSGPETQIAPSLGRTVRLLTAVAIGASFLFLSGLTLTGTVIALIAATPLLVLFSPILVPAGIGVCLATAGFFFSGGFVVAALAALSWVYNYVAGKHPPAVDYARTRIADMKERAKGYAQHVQPKAQEATQGS